MPHKHSNEKKQKIISKKKSEYSGWHTEIKVEFAGVKNSLTTQQNRAVFGELKQSRNEKDRQDVVNSSSNDIQVIFPQYKWHDNRGEYVSDYHHWRKSKENEKEVWTFQIKIKPHSKFEKAKFKISLDGIYDINSTKEKNKIKLTEASKDLKKVNKFNLVDVDNAVMYFYDELKDVNFSMNKLNVRTFRWIKNALADNSDYEKVKSVVDKKSVKKASKKLKKELVNKNEDDVEKDFIPDPPREPGDPFGPPPSF